MTHLLAIIGAGQMAEAIARGLTAGKFLAPQQIIAADVSPQRRELFQTQLGIRAVEDNAQAAAGAGTVLLAVKPQQMGQVLQSLSASLDPHTLVISIAAGISTEFIGRGLGRGTAWRVVRSMPNTPMLIGEGTVAIAAGAHATAQDMTAARRLFETAATVIEVGEDKMDAVTALSGSGPAYFYFLIEQMVRAGVALGLTPKDAHLLATRTAMGAGKMAATASDEPRELRRKVTSPNGTTEAAIKHLESGGAEELLYQAVLAAAARSKELGK